MWVVIAQVRDVCSLPGSLTVFVTILVELDQASGSRLGAEGVTGIYWMLLSVLQCTRQLP